MVLYYRHKEKHDVICEVTGETARFSKWQWRDDVCREVYIHKEVTEAFKETFEQITQEEYNKTWGKKLREA